ncbi:magnesium/cobalt transporter CorA, partial [bacterium]|nr:magnesium/cobalt transporter CorA [bacterium]
DAQPSTLSVVSYGKDSLVEEANPSMQRIGELRASQAVTWVNVDGLGDVALLEQLGEEFGLHRLALEDTLNVPQRPKLDDYQGHQYLVVRMPVTDENLDTEQVSMFLGPGFLVTVQERPGDCLNGVRRRIRDGSPRIRESGSDYLAYAVMDSIVDAYFPSLDGVLGRIDELELHILEQKSGDPAADLQELLSALSHARRYIGPLREVTGTLMREDPPLLTQRTRLYMRDCHDHANHAVDLVESAREVATSLMNLHLSMLSQRMNEVMKVLTIIATVFIPLSFIAGVYGMNFDPKASPWNMPELGWAWGYPAALALMAAVGIGMFLNFVRKGWFR